MSGFYFDTTGQKPVCPVESRGKDEPLVVIEVFTVQLRGKHLALKENRGCIRSAHRVLLVCANEAE